MQLSLFFTQPEAQFHGIHFRLPPTVSLCINIFTQFNNSTFSLYLLGWLVLLISQFLYFYGWAHYFLWVNLFHLGKAHIKTSLQSSDNAILKISQKKLPLDQILQTKVVFCYKIGQKTEQFITIETLFPPPRGNAPHILKRIHVPRRPCFTLTSYIFFPIIISISVDTIVSIVKLDAVKVAAMPSAEKLAMLLLCLLTTFACSA